MHSLSVGKFSKWPYLRIKSCYYDFFFFSRALNGPRPLGQGLRGLQTSNIRKFEIVYSDRPQRHWPHPLTRGPAPAWVGIDSFGLEIVNQALNAWQVTWSPAWLSWRMANIIGRKFHRLDSKIVNCKLQHNAPFLNLSALSNTPRSWIDS